MKIVPIFAHKLFTFHYKGEKQNELRRLLALWNDPSWLIEFVLHHKKDIKTTNHEDVIEILLDDANEIDDMIDSLTLTSGKSIETFFKPLDNLEFGEVILSKQKGRRNYFRLYAIKIDEECYVITGGGIKFDKVHLMQDRPHLQKELDKLERCKTSLKKNGIIDYDSFYELLNE